MTSLSISQKLAKPSTISVAELNDIFRVNTEATTNSFLILALVTLIVYYAYYYSPILSIRGTSLRNIPWKEGTPLFSYKEFHSSNESFIADGIKRFGKIFAFRFMTHKVIAVSSEEARKVFYNHKDLSFSRGWGALRGQGLSPKLSGTRKKDLFPASVDMTPFVKRAAMLFKKERLIICMPHMFKDLSYYIDKWGEKGRFDPWDEYFSALMHLLLHVSAFRDLTLSPEKVHRIGQLYKDLEQMQGFGLIFFPRLTYLSSYIPWLRYITGGIIEDGDKLKKKIATAKELVGYLKPILKERFAERAKGDSGNEPVDDQMQLLINEGDNADLVIYFIMLSLFAGMLNTFKMSCWLTVYVLSDPQIRSQVQGELKALLKSSSAASDEPLSTRLAQVPLEVYESQLPVLDRCIRETIRLNATGVAIRRHVGDKDIVLETSEKGEHVVAKPGECLVSSIMLLHKDEALYPNPTRFDPARYERNEDRKQTFAYLGWGAGRHVCPGKRAAELEMKMLVSFLLLQYPNCSLELEDGTPIDTPEKLPEQDRSSTVMLKPSRNIYIRCT